MKNILIALFILTSMVSAKPKEKAISGAILQTSKEVEILPWTIRGVPTENWLVTEDIIQTLQPLLIEHIKSEWNYLYSNLEKFKCQYFGVVVNGRHQIYCFFYKFTEHDDWDLKTDPVMWFRGEDLDPGGRFNFLYDIRSGDVLNAIIEKKHANQKFEPIWKTPAE